MKNFYVACSTLALSLLSLTGRAAPLVVNPSNDAATLVSSILGSGITVVGAPTYTGANIGAGGTFSGGLDLIGISSGLLLTTGNAVGAVGPNNTPNYTGAGASTSLKFSFTSAGGDLFFNYVFASEEYNEFVGTQFNDTFQLLLDGVNIAKIPGTSTDVRINNVNSLSNSSYYNNNETGLVNIQYDGFTDVFAASALGLAAGEHTIEFLIADFGDASLDSGVFIQGGSFSDKPTPPGGGSRVPDTGSTIAFFVAGVAALAAFRRRVAQT
jgi:hypothetical protein